MPLLNAEPLPSESRDLIFFVKFSSLLSKNLTHTKVRKMVVARRRQEEQAARIQTYRIILQLKLQFISLFITKQYANKNIKKRTRRTSIMPGKGSFFV